LRRNVEIHTNFQNKLENFVWRAIMFADNLENNTEFNAKKKKSLHTFSTNMEKKVPTGAYVQNLNFKRTWTHLVQDDALNLIMIHS